MKHLPGREALSHHVPVFGVLTQYLSGTMSMSNILRNNSRVNADLNNNNDNSRANVDLPKLTIPHETWCRHTGGLLRSNTSVVTSMLNPLTHGGRFKKRLNIAENADSLPTNRELTLNTFRNLN